jgi:hypothetical protein
MWMLAYRATELGAAIGGIGTALASTEIGERVLGAMIQTRSAAASAAITMVQNGEVFSTKEWSGAGYRLCGSRWGVRSKSLAM